MRYLIAAMLALGLNSLAPAARASDGADRADQKAAVTEARMADAERFNLLHSLFSIQLPPASQLPPDLGLPKQFVEGPRVPNDVKTTAGWIKGVPRLGIPDLLETDASLGIANPMMSRKGDVATALPSGLAIASSFDPDLAFDAGAMIGAEARAKGFRILLGGGANLARDPRCGRNFEYLGEDPLLTGTMAGEAVRGTQSMGVISTVKHFSLNAQETLRSTLDARIDDAAHRESDLLAFELAIERGQPGAVMCAYNKVNGAYSCGNEHLLKEVLKRDWKFAGWTMSDWGAVHDVAYFKAGLDQQSGAQLDQKIWFDAPLKAELESGRISRAQVSEAVRRILRSIYAVGAYRTAPQTPIDYAAHAKIARKVASEGIVLLKNDGILPVLKAPKSILVIGGRADIGVLSGGGSSQVIPVGGPAAVIPVGGPGFMGFIAKQVIVPSSPLRALKAAYPSAHVEFESGYFPKAAAARAAQAETVIVFATQWQIEGYDADSLALPEGQDALIAAVAKANPNTIVVLETGNPVLMPWLKDVRAVVEAWYPGQQGGDAIVDIISGAENPSGRLAITFPANEEQLARAEIPGRGAPEGTALAIAYQEGALVGYRWFAERRRDPLYAFGFGLSYTRFEHDSPVLHQNAGALVADVTVRNAGARGGDDVVQLYVRRAAGLPVLRLAAFQRVPLKPGESRLIHLTIDPRLLAHWNGDGWLVRAGDYEFAIGASAIQLEPVSKITLAEQRLKP